MAQVEDFCKYQSRFQVRCGVFKWCMLCRTVKYLFDCIIEYFCFNLLAQKDIDANDGFFHCYKFKFMRDL
jgi:hypothetical protein